jgi:hypothetical protein
MQTNSEVRSQSAEVRLPDTGQEAETEDKSRSGETRDTEQGTGDFSQDGSVEGFGFVQISQVSRGHLEGLVRVGAG